MSSQKILAEMILRNALNFHWSFQGMGFLRLHSTDRNSRLHVWDIRHCVPNVSIIHDHLQWELKSTIIAGQMTNRRYELDPEGIPYRYVYLKPGPGCEPTSSIGTASLKFKPAEVYSEGESYFQNPHEIHSTHPLNGTVTLLEKKPTGDDRARVFWPMYTDWISAEPRVASKEEILSITRYALERWF